MALVSASTAFLGFSNIKQADASVFSGESHVFNVSAMLKNGWFAEFPEVLVSQNASNRTLKAKVASKGQIKKVNAVNLNGKLLVIKGFAEEQAENPEEQASIDELAAMEQIPAANPAQDPVVPAAGGNIETMEILVNVPPLDEPISLEDDGEIQEYTVQPGDTIEAIAAKFKISVDTILWANNLTRSSVIRVGQELVILPISGVAYTIRAGDTVSGIADKFKISQAELVEFNDIEDGRLVVGQILIIPGGTLPSSAGQTQNPPKPTPGSGGNNQPSAGFFSRPIHGGIKTQGIHGHNGIDIAGPIGTPILAAREGKVTLVRGGSGWNGGYGNYVVITHSNGIQTLYAHMNSITVKQGQPVDRGTQVGTLGNTGRSTGPHLHFEVRGAKNPF